MQVIKQAFLYQLLLNVLLIAAIWILTKNYGAYGYPYGVIVVNLVNFAAMYWVCKKLFKGIAYSGLLKYSALLMVINLPVAAVLFYTLSPVVMFPLYKLLLGFCIYLIVLIVMSKIKTQPYK